MESKKNIIVILDRIKYHLDEEISFIEELCNELNGSDFESYSNDLICFFMVVRNIFVSYKKTIYSAIKKIDNLKEGA